MEKFSTIGRDVERKDAWEKVTGAAKYNGDTSSPGLLHGEILTSEYAHAEIVSMDISKAINSPGVQSVITGDYFHVLTGSFINDRPPLAKEKVRYFGEPVALVVATSKAAAIAAARLIEVEYRPLEVVNSIEDALAEDAPIIHEDLQYYFSPSPEILPKAGTNILDQTKIRKGNMASAWAASELIVQSTFSMPQSDHIAMETRNAKAEISPGGEVTIYTSSQAPFAVKEELSQSFSIPEGKITVKTPLVGGAYGGKATVSIEFLAYLASHSVCGRLVELRSSREQDMSSFPSKIGIEAELKVGASRDGRLKALECIYYVDCGAYGDTGPRMAVAMASDCTGPYNIDNVHCDSYSVYTNHNYVTSYRGFGHGALTFCMERMMDKLASKLKMDPFLIREINAIKENNSSPTQARLNLSNSGDLSQCLVRLKKLMDWDEGNVISEDKDMVRAKGISCFWKTSSSPTDAASGVVLTMNSDGSINLNCGAVEIGPGMKTSLCQILSEKLNMDVEKIHINIEVDTSLTPKHWKTVASMTSFMLGNAVIDAGDNLIRKLKEIGAIALRCSANDLDVAQERVYLRDDASKFVNFKDLALGYKYKDEPAISGPVIAQGTYIMKHLKPLNPQDGKGKPGLSWTVGAQGVELVYDTKRHNYKLKKAITVIDVGKVINPLMAKGLIMGGMAMGLGLATREDFVYDKNGILENTSLRTYKTLRYGQQPEYVVEFIENPQKDGPYGARGLGEHGILGIPSAIANALSLASKGELDELPLSPETIWKTVREGYDDTI